MSPTGTLDRAAAVRAAIVRLVADRGFHGASMGAVAKEAGVATGTAYVHYDSKDELIVAAYVEVKRRLGTAATVDVDVDAPARERFGTLWRAAHAHLRAHPDDARFLVQVEHSPYAEVAHEAAMAVDDDRLVAAANAPDLAEVLVDLPERIRYDLALGPVVRLVAAGRDLADDDVETLVESCWRAITRTT